MSPQPTVHHEDDEVTVWFGDCLDVLRSLPDASVDAVVTDPPYGLEFMGKEWDAPWKASGVGRGARVAAERSAELTERGKGHSTSAGPYLASGVDSVRVAGRPFQEWCEAWSRECLRVLKPGGHMLAFGGTRTWHRLACAIEDAGFEIRDSLAWMYGSGFPKGRNVSADIDKLLGAERARVPLVGGGLSSGTANGWNSGAEPHSPTAPLAGTRADGAPITDEARHWEGWNVALKPAFEPIVVARKPLAGTVAANVLAHGTGALNIDGCRVAHASEADLAESVGKNQHAKFGTPAGQNNVYGDYSTTKVKDYDGSKGRWPANVILDESQSAALDEQSGELHSQDPRTRASRSTATGVTEMGTGASIEYADTGGASRFFYVAKASSKERPVVDGVAHPTVKPLALMRWLVRLVTPPGGVVLEPFAGSGTTVEACIAEGFRCVAIERGAEYLPLIDFRIRRRGVIAPDPKPIVEPDPDDLSFDYLPGGAA